MAQQLKVFAGKLDDLNLILETHMVVRKNQPSKVDLWCSHMS